MPVYPGVYGSPINKVATAQIPLVSGYATGRMMANLALASSGNPTSNPVVSGYQTVSAVFRNSGVAATVQLYQTDNLASGPRVVLGNPIALVADGLATAQFIPQAHWVEFNCIAGGPSFCHVQLASQMDWTLEGFSKIETIYPQYQVAAIYPPAYGAVINVTSPQIVFGS